MAAFESTSSATPVSLSGMVTGATSYSFAGTGILSVSSGMSGTFNGGAALLQTTTISGKIDVGGSSTPYTSSVANAYESSGIAAILGESQGTEFDVASAPIMIPSSVGSTAVVLGTLSRYADSTLSVALGTVQISVDVEVQPADPGSPEVVRFTFRSHDMSGALVETDTQSYYLTEASALSFHGAAASGTSGSLSVTTTP
jgi:hypothetical protein